MSKGFAFVVGYSIFLLILFSGMCYLMTTVEPAPLKGINTRKPNGSRRFFNLNIKPLIVDELAVGDNAEYGLERVKEDEFMLRSRYPLYAQTTPYISRLNPPDFPDIVTVVPPIWPSATEQQNLYAFNNIDIDSKEKTSSEIEFSPNKGQRRSVKKNDVDNGPGIITFKVLDDNGRPRIEIKLGDLTKKNVTINKFKRNSKFSVSTASDYDAVERNVLSDNSIIKIMSNDTVVIYDDENSSQTVGKDCVNHVRVNDDKQVLGDTLVAERNVSQRNEVKNSNNYINTTSSPKQTLSDNHELNDSTTVTMYTITRNFTLV